MSLRTETVSARLMVNCGSPAEYLTGMELLMSKLQQEANLHDWQPLWDTLELSTEVDEIEEQMLVREDAVRTSLRYLVASMSALRNE